MTLHHCYHYYCQFQQFTIDQLAQIQDGAQPDLKSFDLKEFFQDHAQLSSIAKFKQMKEFFSVKLKQDFSFEQPFQFKLLLYANAKKELQQRYHVRQISLLQQTRLTKLKKNN